MQIRRWPNIRHFHSDYHDYLLIIKLSLYKVVWRLLVGTILDGGLHGLPIRTKLWLFENSGGKGSLGARVPLWVSGNSSRHGERPEPKNGLGPHFEA